MSAAIRDGRLEYTRMLRRRAIPTSDIVWAYVQSEDTTASMCCGRASFEIGRLIVVTADGARETLQYEGTSEPKRLLEELRAAAPNAAIGWSEENARRFGGPFSDTRDTSPPKK